MSEPNQQTREDVTDLVTFDNPDDEALPITKCVCGAKFPVWQQVVSIYDGMAWMCPHCGVKLVFSNGVRVYKLS